MRVRGTAIALSSLLLAGVGNSARTEEKGVPGSKVEVVRLDAVVTDGKGNLVRGLTRLDFELKDDGKVQQLSQFVFIGQEKPVGQEKAAGAETSPAPSEKTAAATEWETPGPGRHVAILVDDLHIAPGGVDSVKQALKRVVDEFLLPDDKVALITTSSPAGVHGLSEDRAPLKQEIEALASRQTEFAPAKGSRMTAEQAELILRGDSQALLLASRMLVEEPGSLYQGVRGAPRGQMTAGTGANPKSISEDPREQEAAVEAAQQARGVLAEALRTSTASLSRVDDVLRGLATLPGRKLCLLVSEGFLVGAGTSEERTRELQRIVDAATRSGAVVYALDAHGLATGIRDASLERQVTSAGLQASVVRQSDALLRTTLQTVSNDTGGFLVRATNDLAGGVRRMLEDNEAYYLMAYEPANLKPDGRFHKIALRLRNHPELTVRTRMGYYAPGGKEGVRTAEYAPQGPARPVSLLNLDEKEAWAVLSAPISKEGLPLELSADYLDLPPKGSQAVVRTYLDVGKLPWEKAGGHHRTTVDLVGAVYDQGGKPVGAPFGQHLQLDLPSDRYQQAAKEGYREKWGIPLAPGRYEVRLIVRRPGEPALGGASQWVEVPDLREKKLTLSSIFLYASALQAQPLDHPPPVPWAAPPTEAIWDAQAGRYFQRSETLNFAVYVYNPSVGADGKSDVALQVQIASQGKVLAASKLQPAALQQKDGVPVPEMNSTPLQGLAPGPYQLRVVVVDRKASVTAARAIDFVVQ
jgi:VWFA-related protein